MKQAWNDLQTSPSISGHITRGNLFGTSDVLRGIRINEVKPLAKLIHKTYASYLPTAFPVHYYGMPNGKIYIIYSRFYEIKFGGSGMEFVFAEHKEFNFDYVNELIVPVKKLNTNSVIFAESIDKPNEDITILNIRRGLNSYGEAFNILNQEAREMIMYA